MDSISLEKKRQEIKDAAWAEICRLNAELENVELKVSEPKKSEPLKIQEKNGVKFIIHFHHKGEN